MASVQLNIRTTPLMMDELDHLVDDGYFKSRSEAVNEAIRELVRRYQLLKIRQDIEKIANENHGNRSLTEALLEIRREEDERLS